MTDQIHEHNPFDTHDNETPGVASGGENPPLPSPDGDYYQWDFHTCPRCDRPRNGYPALSRVDNKTYICSMCGTDEGLTAITSGELPGLDYWPIPRWSSSSKPIDYPDEQ